MNVEHPVHELTYKCFACDREYTRLGDGVDPEDFVASPCCSGKRSLLVNDEPIEGPTWEQIKQVYESA